MIPETPASLWLQVLFGEATGWASAWEETSKRSRFMRLPDQALDFVDLIHAHATARVGQGTLAQVPPGASRGADADVGAVTAVSLDVDLAGLVHGRHGLPPSITDAVLALRGAQIAPPTMGVATPGGWHPLWVLQEPWRLANRPEQVQARRWARAFTYRAQAAWKARHWALDDVSSLTRLLRPPDSLWAKPGFQPARCQLTRGDGRVCGLEDMAAADAWPRYQPEALADIEDIEDLPSYSNITPGAFALPPERLAGIQADGEINALRQFQPGPAASTPYGLRAVTLAAGELCSTPVGGRHKKLWRVSLEVGQLISGGLVTWDEALPQLYEAAQWSWRAGTPEPTQGEIPQTIYDGLARGLTEPRKVDLR